jgi:toxin CcdB
MARLDLYRLRGMAGYLLEVQADLMSVLSTTVVVPLLNPDTIPKPMVRLNPVFEIDGVLHIMVTQSIAAIPKKELGRPVGALSESKRYDVVNALDMLLSGS